MYHSHVSKIKAEENLKLAVEKAVNELGGMNQFVDAGDTVFLKPNINTADPFPASTDIEFLRIVVQLLLEVNPKRIIIGESSAINENTRKNLAITGIHELGNLSTLVSVVNLDREPWVKRTIPNGRYLKKVKVPQLIGEVDRLIFLPCLKTHHLAQFSGSLKLSVGLMKPRQRIRLHIRNLQQKIAELNTIIHPDLVVMDARKCFINGGPSAGEVRNPDLIMASTDRLAIDVEGVNIIKGYEGNSLFDVMPLEIAHLKLASELGIGGQTLAENLIAS